LKLNIKRSMISFLNSSGGIIYFGINSNKIIGYDLTKID
jgi:hypothetical protein